MSKKIETIDVDATVIDRVDETTLFEQVTTWLEQQEWKYDDSGKPDFLSFSLSIKDASVRVCCWIHDAPDWKRLSATAIYYTRVPAHRRAVDLADQYLAPLLAIAFGNAPADQVLEMRKRAEQATLQ